MRSWCASVVLVIKRALSQFETMQEYLVAHGATPPTTCNIFTKEWPRKIRCMFLIGQGAGSGGVVEAMAQENVVEIFEEDWAKGHEAYQEEFRGVLDDD